MFVCLRLEVKEQFAPNNFNNLELPPLLPSFNTELVIPMYAGMVIHWVVAYVNGVVLARRKIVV